jgi:hypothetical protein
MPTYTLIDIQDKVFIVIPSGFPNEGQIARLDKATYSMALNKVLVDFTITRHTHCRR